VSGCQCSLGHCHDLSADHQHPRRETAVQTRASLWKRQDDTARDNTRWQPCRVHKEYFRHHDTHCQLYSFLMPVFSTYIYHSVTEPCPTDVGKSGPVAPVMRIPMCMSPIALPPGYQIISCSDMISMGSMSRHVTLEALALGGFGEGRVASSRLHPFTAGSSASRGGVHNQGRVVGTML
jgi:hypothetical protein